MNADVKFKFVTPCILAGADQKKAETRAPSVRGQLRWWSKALGYGDMPNVFGSVGKGSPRASAMVVRDLSEHLETSRGNCESLTGNKFDYFLWPMRPTKHDTHAGDRGYIKPGQEAHVTISEKKVKSEVTLPDQVLKAFLLLGALGTRSRRCYGSIWPTSAVIDGDEWNIPTTMEEFKSELVEILDEDADVYIRALSDTPLGNSGKAIATCAEFLKKFRCGSTRSGKPSTWGQNDHDARFGKARVLYRPALGLPLTQRYSRDNVTVRTEIRGLERLASPVHLKVVPLDGGFWPIMLCFQGHAESVGRDATLTDRGRRLGNFPVEDDLLLEMMFPDPDIWDSGDPIGDFRKQ